MTANLSQRQRQQKQKAKQALAQMTADYKWLMGTKAGRRLVWMWLERAGVFHTGYRSHTGETYFAAGQREMGLKLYSDILEYARAEFVSMNQENSAPWREQITNYDDRRQDSEPGSNEE